MSRDLRDHSAPHTLGAVYFAMRGECEVALPAVYSAKAPQPRWFEQDAQHATKTTPDEPNSRRQLFVGLFDILVFIIGWLLRRRQQRKIQPVKGKAR